MGRRGANRNHHLGLSDSDRPRLVVVIWVGTLFLAFPHPYRLNGAIMGASAYLFWTDHTKNISHWSLFNAVSLIINDFLDALRQSFAEALHIKVPVDVVGGVP